MIKLKWFTTVSIVALSVAAYTDTYASVQSGEESLPFFHECRSMMARKKLWAFERDLVCRRTELARSEIYGHEDATKRLKHLIAYVQSAMIHLRYSAYGELPLGELSEYTSGLPESMGKLEELQKEPFQNSKKIAELQTHIKRRRSEMGVLVKKVKFRVNVLERERGPAPKSAPNVINQKNLFS